MREPRDWDLAGEKASDDESTSVTASAIPFVVIVIGR
jgi:hypothetical protein